MSALSSAAKARVERVTAGHFIDGKVVPPASGKFIDVVYPGNGSVFARIPAGDAADIDGAVAVARRVYRSGVWSRMDPAGRGRVMLDLAKMIRDELETLAELETWDVGKPIAEARMDIAGTADIVEYYAGLANKIFGQTQQLPGQQMGMIVREPVGVAGLITPWNYPAYVGAWKFAPALACGNTVVMKPSELTSLTALVIAHMCIEAGMPRGVFNVVTGYGAEAGARLSTHPDVDVLGFTGGPVSGKIVLRARAELLRPTQLELGGKSPNIVFGDADLDQAVAGAAYGIFFNQGENCNAGSRLLVHTSVYNEFVSRLQKVTESIRVGNPLNDATRMGALISAAHLAKVEGHVTAAVAEGARLVTGGKRLTDGEFAGGFFFAPTVLADVLPTHRVFQEEVFGPVVTVTKFETDDEALEQANGTEYGLAAGVWTKDVSRALRFTRDIQAGYVWINNYNATPVEAPFGGQKGSGFGRDCGVQAIETYTTWKTVVWSYEPFQPYY